MTSETFGRRLARLRTAAGLSQPALARMVGVHRQTIARLEGGGSLPLGETALAIASALSVTVEELLGVKAGAVEAERIVAEFVASGEAGMMLPPPTEKELQWLRENPDSFAGPSPTPRAVGYILLSLRARPGWAS